MSSSGSIKYSSRYMHLPKKGRGITKKEEETMTENLMIIVNKRRAFELTISAEDVKKEMKEKEKTQKHFDKAKARIVNRTIPLTEEVLSFFTPLVKNLVKFYMIAYPNQNYEELSQAAYDGVIHGLNLFNPDYNNKPTTYVHPWVKNRIQTSIKDRGNIVKKTSVYHSLKSFLAEKIIENGMSISEVYALFPASKRGDGWVIPPPETGLKHKATKLSTIKRHIEDIETQIIKNKQFEVKGMSEYYEDIYDYDNNNDFVYTMFTSDSFIKNSIYKALDSTDDFTNKEKNLYLEYNDIAEPRYLIQPNITFTVIPFQLFNRQRKQFSKGIFFSKKYNMPISKIKNKIEEINVFLKKELTGVQNANS